MKQKIVSFYIRILLFFVSLSCYTYQLTIQLQMTDQLDGMFLQFQQKVVFLSSSPYTPSDYNCQLLAIYDLTNCYLSSDSTRFYLNLYSNTTLQKNLYKNFHSLPFYYLDQQFQNLQFNGALGLPQNMIPPSVILSYQQPYVNICEDTQIKIISELVNGNNNLTYKKWNLESMNPSNSANAVALTQILANFESKNYLTLPQQSLNENTNYQFSVEVVNFIGTSNKVLFNLKTLSKNTPFIKVISPSQFNNIDFRNDFQLQISYNTTVCGSSSNPAQQNKITVSLQDGSNQLYSLGVMTGTGSQIFNLTIPSQFLQSAKSYIIAIQLDIQAQSSTYQQSISITTMNPIITSSSQNPITDFIQDNGQPILLNMDYSYIDTLKVDKAQFSTQWNCIDLSLLSNSCTKLFNPSLNQNIQGMLSNRMYQITFSIAFGNQISYSTFNIVLADLSNTDKNKIYQFYNNIQSYDRSASNAPNPPNFNFILQISPSFKGKTLIRQNIYQPFNLAIYMINFEVLKVDIPDTNDIIFQLQDLVNLKQQLSSQYNLLSIALFNRKILHTLFDYSFENVDCQFTLSSSYVEAFTDITKLSLKNCQKSYNVFIYSDYQKLQKDISQQSIANGYLVYQYLQGIQSINLAFSNNANKQNYNQFYILGISSDLNYQMVSTVNVIENTKIMNLNSLKQIAYNLIQNNNQISINNFQNNRADYINYLIVQQLEYLDQKSCSQSCSINGSCQLQNILPFNQTQSIQCQCQQNYFFYDCTASQSDMNSFLNFFRENQISKIQYDVQILKLLAQVQSNIYLYFFSQQQISIQYIYPSFVFQQFYDLSIFSPDFGCQDLIDQTYDFLDQYISYSNIYQNNPNFDQKLVKATYGVSIPCQFVTGSPAYYFTKNNFCGMAKQVPYPIYYLSQMFSTNQIIVNQICDTGQLQSPSFKDISIPYYPGQHMYQYNQTPCLKLKFLKQAFANYYQDQIKPGFSFSIDQSDQNPYNFTLYFDIPTFYKQNKQLSQNLNFKFQKLICIFNNQDQNWEMCIENQIVIQGNSSLLKCICASPKVFYQLYTNDYTVVFIDDHNYEFIFANEIFSYQQIAIIGYLGLMLTVQIIFSVIGLNQDKKKKVQIGVFPIRRQSTIVDINQIDLNQDINQDKKLDRRSSILLEINNEEIANSKNSNFCSTLIKAHSVGKIYFNYSLNFPRFQRYLTQFFIYLSLPAVGGLYAKYQLDTLIYFNLAYFCICMSPFGLRLGMSIFDLIYYNINKCIKIKIINYPLILIMNILFIGFYGFLGYIYYRLWTDSNSKYLQNWLIFSIIMLIFHAIIFEFLYMTISIYYVRSEFQKKLQKIRKLQLKKQVNYTQKESNDQINLPYNKLPSNDPGNFLTLETHENQLTHLNRQSQLVLLTKTTLLDKMQIEQIDGDLNIQGKNQVIQLQPTKSQIILKQKTLQKL
ncbi:transmembrane protein, putative (macronuclear) [Tetrahymena thermophila SB210]|uniref:Transmembrane protein, putative n=1 Tax=Tetrahymena thermophila (strain SB210) TaxID=312017 RepID=W7XKN9_TETTS|nr:transmembrane protein, putative [Tetrahymena thermophila SB210]EWS75079.1 transmembrane protein, putative [Tetrahymena thermophila SB210]|eukprot:XP_012652392.1 transmembrane protein, putative [Tetrahymena thermophila SB210]